MIRFETGRTLAMEEPNRNKDWMVDKKKNFLRRRRFYKEGRDGRVLSKYARSTEVEEKRRWVFQAIKLSGGGKKRWERMNGRSLAGKDFTWSLSISLCSQ